MPRQMTYADFLKPEMERQDRDARSHTRLGRLSLVLRQPQARKAYLHPKMQYVIALLILGNFATNVVEKQMDPRGDRYDDNRWFLIDSVWNGIFCAELLWNMWGCFYLTTWSGHFFSSPWNLFDFL